MSTIQLFAQNPDTPKREPLGEITEEQLQFLIDHLEEEFEEERAYYLDQDTIDYLAEEGADGALIQLLQKGIASLGPEEGIEITYARQ